MRTLGNVNEIAFEIKHRRIINKTTSLMMEYNQEDIEAYMDSNTYTLQDIKGKNTVYYILIGDYHYIGVCNVLPRRIQEHMRGDSKNRIYKFIKQNQKIYYKPIAFFDELQSAKNYERELINAAKYQLGKSLLNIL